MARLDSSLLDVHRVEELARQDTFLHRLDPRAKILSTLVFLVAVLSYGKYEVSALVPFFVFPVVVAAAGSLPAGYVLKRLAWALPFALLVGAFNPWLDRAPRILLGDVRVAGGWVSFLSILLRVALSVAAAVTLVGVTGLARLGLGLGKLGVPRVLVMQLLVMHRYLFVLLHEGLRMRRARALRAAGHRMDVRLYGPFVGHLFQRALARAERVHRAMCCRGFDGRVRAGAPLAWRAPDALFLCASVTLFALLRTCNVARLVGGAVLEVLS
jgi:cobalt/nickel transport system permease protein